MRNRHLTLAATVAALGGGVLGAIMTFAPGAATVAATTHHRVALRATTSTPLAHPALNVAPTPDYWPVCLTSGPTSAACIDAEVAAINNARALEGVPPMTLPSAFALLPPAQQTFVVSNLERVDRGLAPAAGMVDTLNTLSTTAAQNDADPALPSWTVGPFSANRWGSIWAGDLNALAADYDWMYNDGWGPSGSYNLDCTSATASGCWGHRDNIISAYGGAQLITGVGSVAQSQWTSIAQIFVAGIGSYPTFTLAWSDIAGTSATPVANSNAVAPSVHTTQATVTAPATSTAGRSVTVAGRLTDVTTGTGVPAAPVFLCHRATTSSTSACSGGTTDSTGRAVIAVHPTASTYYWLTYAGSSTLTSAASSLSVVHVRPLVQLQRAHTTTGWRIGARVAPAHSQVVRLQRLTSHGWATVSTRRATSSFAFARLRSGTYRLVVASARGLLSASAVIRCA